jgi:nucleoside-diphosphate-sugar epimerase
MRILLTGHKGYIGSRMLTRLLDRGLDVTGLDACYFEACTFGTPPPEIPEYRVDLRDVKPEMLQGFDAVIHLAGLCNDPLSEFNPQLTHDINNVASVQLAEMAKKAGVKRFVASSSCSVYGAAGDHLIDETAPMNPVTIYARSKRVAEVDTQALASDSFSPVFLRNATVYGNSPRLRLDLVLNDFVAAALTSGNILIKSDGTPWRPMVHIDDVCQAFLVALEAPRETIHNKVFNVGDNAENYRVSEMADIVTRVVPGSRIEYAAGGGPDKRCYRVDCSLIRRETEFRAQWSAEKGAAEMFAAFQAAGMSQELYESPRFRRLQWTRKLINEGLLSDDLRWTVKAAAA